MKQNLIDLQQLSGEKAVQLGLSMLGEVNREKQVGFMYRKDQRTKQEIILITGEWLEKNIASKEFEKWSFKNFIKGACRGKKG